MTPSELETLAEAAALQSDWMTAERCWRECVEAFDSQAKVSWYRDRAMALSQLGRLDEAGGIYAAMRSRWPSSPVGWHQGARNATDQKNWPLAVQLWRGRIARFEAQAQPGWWGALANALLQQELYGEAREVGRAAQIRFPTASHGWEIAARVASKRGAWEPCGRAWEAAAERVPAEAAFDKLQSGIVAFINAGRFTDAARLRGKQDPRTSNETQTWLSSGLKLFLAQGDFRNALAFLDAHEADDEFTATFTAAQMANVAYEAGMAPAAAIERLVKWVSSEEAADAIDAAYLHKPADFEEISTLVEERARRARIDRDRLASVRSKLKAFLHVRTYSRFRSLEKDGFGIATPTQTRALRSIAQRLFPASPLRLLIDHFLGAAIADRETDAYASGWRTYLPRPGNAISDQLRGLPRQKLLCATVVRNEAEMLPGFFAHYAAMGVRDFVVLDNGSTDNLGGAREGIPGLNIAVIDCPFPYNANRNGMTWVNEILESGICDWLLHVDADERLVFPGCEDIPLPELIEHYDRRGETAMPALMLDLYDEQYAAGQKPSDNIDEHNLFYARYSMEKSLFSPYIQNNGRTRVARGIVTDHTKPPLVRAISNTRYATCHRTNASMPAQTTGVLLHYKVFHDRGLIGLQPQDVLNHPQVRDRISHTTARILEFSLNRAEPWARDPFTLVFSGSSQLERLGYLVADDEWRARCPDGVSRQLTENARQARPGLIGLELRLQRSFLTQLDYGELITAIETAAKASQRQRVRELLNGNLVRIRSRVVALGLLLFTASLLGASGACRRIAAAIVCLIESRITAEEVRHLEPILLNGLAGSSKVISLEILNALDRAGSPTPELATTRHNLMLELGVNGVGDDHRELHPRNLTSPTPSRSDANRLPA